jgi:hypothetical protein
MARLRLHAAMSAWRELIWKECGANSEEARAVALLGSALRRFIRRRLAAAFDGFYEVGAVQVESSLPVA